MRSGIPTYFNSAFTINTAGTLTTTVYAVTPPAGMLQGDLVVVHALSWTADTTTCTTTGGQTWNSQTPFNGTNLYCTILWCTFNGTWAANPQFTMASNTQDIIVHMGVFRPGNGTASAWGVDTAVAGAAFAAPGAAPGNVTVTGITPTNTNNVTIAGWIVAGQLPTWTLQTAGWTNVGASSYQNSSNKWLDLSLAYKIQTLGLATGNVANQESTNIAGEGWTIAFYEIAANRFQQNNLRPRAFAPGNAR